MDTWVDSLIRTSTRLAEKGLFLMDTTLRTLQSTVARLAGQEPDPPPVSPPIEGPATLDQATADMANRLVRIAWKTPLERASLLQAYRDTVFSAKQSFGGLNWMEPRQWMALPLQLPLSIGTLMLQQSLRALYALDIIGPEKLLGFGTYILDSFTDIQIFINLEYKEMLKRQKDYVRRNPDDSRARLELGRTYIKLGLYTEALAELSKAAEDSATRAEALSESMVAAYRAGDYRQAMKDGAEALKLDGSAERTRYWLYLTAQKLGGYSPEVSQELRMDAKAGRAPTRLELKDVSREIGLDKTSAGRGTAIFDFDGDGYLDVVISSAHGGLSLYRNKGDGTFTDITIGSGLDAEVNTFIVAVGDYNNDGLDDLYITRLGFYDGESILYRNNGDGTFTNVTKEAGVGCWGPTFTAQWVDYDCDGYLDLFVANNLAGLFDRKTPNRLFHNNGDGTFTEVSEQAGLRTVVPTIGSAWGDYNNDNYPDLFLSSGIGRFQLFRNNGDGTFTDVSREAGIDEVGFGTICLWLDYDNDGWLDLAQFMWSPEEDVLHTLKHGVGPEAGSPMRIWHNNRDGTFTRKDREIGLDGCWGTMSANAGDFNNDGFVDFLLGNGDPHMNRTEPPIILESDGSGRFRNTSFAAGLPYIGKGHGSNMADLAGDGRMCLIMCSGGAYPGDLMTVSVFRPSELPGNYLNVRLVGRNSNRNAVGARIKLEAQGRAQHRLVNGGTAFGHLPYEQHFGLADCTRVDALEICWPSGLRQRLTDLPFNTTIRIVEGQDFWEEVYGRAAAEAAVAV